MPPARKLKAFLKDKAKRARLGTPKAPQSSNSYDFVEPLILQKVKFSEKAAPDSLFGESIPINEIEELSTSKASRTVSVLPSAEVHSPSSRKPSQNEEIGALRKELETLLLREVEATSKTEKRALAVEK